eukprot:4362443-Amphidinium_carterae.1
MACTSRGTPKVTEGADAKAWSRQNPLVSVLSFAWRGLVRIAHALEDQCTCSSQLVDGFFRIKEAVDRIGYIQYMFKQIAPQFVAQHASDQALRTAAKNICRRITATEKPQDHLDSMKQSNAKARA